MIENKTGAGGMIATEAAARSDPDGYTLLNTPLANAVNETLSKSIRVSLGKDMIAVGAAGGDRQHPGGASLARREEPQGVHRAA